MTELLSPAGDFSCALTALYNGCDAIYCALERFGARAYARNLTEDELKKLLQLAHSLNKKIYVTVNTIIKDNELNDSIEFINNLYKLGVDGLILADYALITYVIENLPEMEAHISTQAGLKYLEDVLYFEKLKAKRCVLAREVSFDDIKYIKENTNMPLEIFAHGALCVSYSGGCLMSSMLTLRSGNRGRCSQNCRREYTLYKNNDVIDSGFMLSMRDLCTFDDVNKLKDINVDSLKLEGRMKNEQYVKIVTSEYRKKLDDRNYKSTMLENIFHRNYTKGFIFNEDRGKIVDIGKKNNEGKYIGTIIKKDGNLTLVNIIDKLSIKDRIKIEDDEDYYFTVDEIFNLKKQNVNNISGNCYLNIYKNMKNNSKIYKMIDSSIDISFDNKYKLPIIIKASGKLNDNLKLETEIHGIKFEAISNEVFQSSLTKPIDSDTLFKQLAKLNDTSFYLDKVINNLEGNLFMTISAINNTRRILVDKISDYFQYKRELKNIDLNIEKINYDIEDIKLTAFCVTQEQYDMCKELGIKDIYYKNYAKYVRQNNLDIAYGEYILCGNYGDIYKYNDKTLISDYSFNVINSKAIYDLHKANVKYVTLSVETSYKELDEIGKNYQKYGNNPNLEMIVYGRINLMTLKYCPLRRYNECNKCKENKYYIKDSKEKFPIYHDGCITHIVNSKPLNLIDDIKDISKVVKRLRLQFTTEGKDEVKDIILKYQYRLKNIDSNIKQFDSQNETRGLFKREIL